MILVLEWSVLVFMMKTIILEINFGWLTSYDASRKEEDKLRKVVSEETAFKKEVNSSSPLQYSLEKGVTLSTFSPDSLSQPKDTTNINIEQ